MIYQEDQIQPPAILAPFPLLGNYAIYLLTDLCRMGIFLLQSLVGICTTPFRFREVVKQLHFIGTGSVAVRFLGTVFITLGWLALEVSELSSNTGSKIYPLMAEFDNISGVKTGADIQIAGVKVGTVGELALNQDAVALLTMQINRPVEVPVDSIASVRLQGIIGDKFIQISLGGDEKIFQEG